MTKVAPDMPAWKHNDLAADLAQYLRAPDRMVWADMQLGPSGSPRPDVYTLEKSYSKPMPTAYECKISRSDLRSDTTSGKWQKYLQFAGAVIFAVPEGLCTPADIPPSCGLIVRKANVWRMARKATRTPASLPMDACMKLLIDGVNRSIERQDPRPRIVKLWQDHAAVRKKFGEAVARAARDLVSAQSEATDFDRMRKEGWARVDGEVATYKARLLDTAKRDMAEFESAKRDLVDWLGLPADASTYLVRRRIEQMKCECDADARVERAVADLARARSSVQHALNYLTPAEAGA